MQQLQEFMTDGERRALAVLGVVGFAALGILFWRQQRPPLVLEGSPTATQAAVWEEALATARQVDLNRATAAELERLPHVGPTLARRIVEHRATYGPFRSRDELLRVRGVGPKTSAALTDYITVGSEER